MITACFISSWSNKRQKNTHTDLPWRTHAGHRPLTLCQSVSLHLCSQGAGVLSVPRKTRVDGEALEEASQEG